MRIKGVLIYKGKHHSRHPFDDNPTAHCVSIVCVFGSADLFMNHAMTRNVKGVSASDEPMEKIPSQLCSSPELFRFFFILLYQPFTFTLRVSLTPLITLLLGSNFPQKTHTVHADKQMADRQNYRVASEYSGALTVAVKDKDIFPGSW